MRARDEKKTRMSLDKIKHMGQKISSLFGKDSMVMWAAQGYETFRFDFYLFERPRRRMIELSVEEQALADVDDV